MKQLFVAAAILVTSISSSFGRSDSAASELLSSGMQQSSLYSDHVSPLQLDVDFVAQVNVPQQGHVTLKWAAKDRWWRKIVMGEFQQIEIRSGDRLYTSRNVGFTPIRVRELISLLQFAEGSERLRVKKQKQKVQNGIEATCLQVEHENVRTKPHEICLNSVSHEILSEDWQEPPDERRREQFSNYFDFQARRFPRKLELFVNGSRVITVDVHNITTTTFDETLLIPPSGAIERQQCADMKHPVPVHTPDPMYPKSASQNRLMGDTTVAMTVLTDGSVTDIRLIGSAAQSMDDATLQTLRSWKFKPATCGADPVAWDIEVVVSFRLQ